MTDLNKIISLFIGLFVVIFLVAIALGRINIGKKRTPSMGGALGRIFGISNEITPTAPPTPKTVSIQKTVESDGTGTTRVVTTPTLTTSRVTKTAPQAKQIPQTGAGLIIPYALSSLVAGVYLRRLTQKK